MNAPRAGLAARTLSAALRAYRFAVSPLIGPRCRFAPSCSEYALEAVEVHGALVGAALAIRRVARCHPFGGHGYDPVPPATEPPVREDPHA